jgi:exosortase/archaeosortase family protein
VRPSSSSSASDPLSSAPAEERVRERRSGARTLVLAATALACWPVWPWYVARLADSPDDAAALVALVLLAVLPGRRPVAPAATGARALLPTALALGAYAASTPFVPRLASALLAFLALGFAWSLWRHGTPFRPWAVGLGLLGLPMASSLQFYLGYPLRIASGAVALVLLRLGGVAVDREGVYLRAGGELVMIDAPCSGMRMLWAALLLACCLSALFRLHARASLLAAGAAALLAVLGNGLRTSALFWADTHAPQLPAFSHAGIGAVAFAMLAVALFGIARALSLTEGRACAPTT